MLTVPSLLSIISISASVSVGVLILHVMLPCPASCVSTVITHSSSTTTRFLASVCQIQQYATSQMPLFIVRYGYDRSLATKSTSRKKGFVALMHHADSLHHHLTATLTCYLTFAGITRRSGVDFKWRTWDRITSIFDLGVIFADIFRCIMYCYCGIFVICYIWSQISTIRSLQGVSTCIHLRTT